jgi:hypothetical protein
MQWRPQEVKDARNVEHLLRKAAGSKQSLPREKGHVGTQPSGKATGAGLPQSMGVHIMTPCAPMPVRQKAIEFNICPAGFQYLFGWNLPCCSPILPF